MTLEEANEPQLPSQGTAASRGTETLLLVDDEFAVRNVMKIALEKTGYIVKEASGGEEALSEVEAGDSSFALLVADVVLPRMNGKELCTAGFRYYHHKPGCCMCQDIPQTSFRITEFWRQAWTLCRSHLTQVSSLRKYGRYWTGDRNGRFFLRVWHSCRASPQVMTRLVRQTVHLQGILTSSRQVTKLPSYVR